MSSPANSRRGHLETNDTNNSNATIFLCCPHCRGTYQIKDMDQFLDYKRLIWHMLLRKIEDGTRKQRIIGTLAVCNARETMLQKIVQDGTSRHFLQHELSSGLRLMFLIYVAVNAKTN